MTIDDHSYIDLLAFLQRLRRERQPTVVVHGPPLAGKSRYARQLAKQPGVVYVDVLTRVAADPVLAADVEQVDPTRLRDLLAGEATDTGAQVVIVDELDFLIPVWGNELQPFQEMVRRISVPFGARVAFAFFMQSRPEFLGWDLITAGRQPRVLSFEDLRAAPRAPSSAMVHEDEVGNEHHEVAQSDQQHERAD